MKFAYSTNAYRNFTLEQTVQKVSRLGYRAVELLADVPHAWPAGLLPIQIEQIRELLERNRLYISNINAFMMNAVADPRQPYWHPSWIEPSADYRAIRREHTKRCLHLAAELGAKNIQTNPGGPIPEGMSRQQAYDIFYDEIMPCIEVAESTGVDLLIEPEPMLLIEKFEQYLEFANRVNSPKLGLNFDIGHAFCVGQEPLEWIPVMAEHTRHYHVEDINEQRVHHHLIPGEGVINFRPILNAIEQSGYKGWVTVELYPYVDDPDIAGGEALRVLRGFTDDSESLG